MRSNLFDFMHKKFKNLGVSTDIKEIEFIVRDLCEKLCQALHHLHLFGIILRDFDAKNITIYEMAELHPEITTIHNFTVQGPGQLTEKIYGDISYKAPEVLQGKPYN